LDHVRQRGFAPELFDSAVRTLELVGEFLGFDQLVFMQRPNGSCGNGTSKTKSEKSTRN
jgi:hypothetical protein